MVLENGVIKEVGTHAEFLAKNATTAAFTISNSSQHGEEVSIAELAEVLVFRDRRTLRVITAFEADEHRTASSDRTGWHIAGLSRQLLLYFTRSASTQWRALVSTAD